MPTRILPEAVVARRSAAGDVIGLLAVILYALSFFLPATRWVVGYQVFVCSLVFVICIPMWAANLVFWAGLAELCLGRYRSAGLAGLVAVVLALSECWMFTAELRVGYFVWVGSMALLAFVGLCGTEENRPRWPARVGSNIAGAATRIASRFPAVGHGPHGSPSTQQDASCSASRQC
jgi:hypothetical protein